MTFFDFLKIKDFKKIIIKNKLLANCIFFNGTKFQNHLTNLLLYSVSEGLRRKGYEISQLKANLKFTVCWL